MSLALKASQLLQQLEELPNLQSNPTINRLFAELVSLACHPLSQQESDLIISKMAAGGMLTRLHHLCAKGETELEHYWSHRLANAADMPSALEDFPYLEEYRLLVDQEMALLKNLVSEPRRVLFIGSGPLPLSAYLMATEHEIEVDMLDADSHTHTCARGWLSRDDAHHKLTCVHADARIFQGDMTSYDAIILASLAGVQEEDKQAIIGNLSSTMAPGQSLLLRSVHGLKRILYPEVRAEYLQGFTTRHTWVPDNHVINSVILAQRT